MRPISNKVSSLFSVQEIKKNTQRGAEDKAKRVFLFFCLILEEFVKWCSKQLKVKPVMNCMSVTNESFSTM